MQPDIVIPFYPRAKTAVREAVDLERSLALLGFEPGSPPHITDATQRDLRRMCSSMQCPRCTRRGMTCKPYHRNRTFTVVAVCANCCAGEEV